MGRRDDGVLVEDGAAAKVVPPASVQLLQRHLERDAVGRRLLAADDGHRRQLESRSAIA